MSGASEIHAGHLKFIFKIGWCTKAKNACGLFFPGKMNKRLLKLFTSIGIYHACYRYPFAPIPRSGKSNNGFHQIIGNTDDQMIDQFWCPFDNMKVPLVIGSNVQDICRCVFYSWCYNPHRSHIDLWSNAFKTSSASGKDICPSAGINDWTIDLSGSILINLIFLPYLAHNGPYVPISSTRPLSIAFPPPAPPLQTGLSFLLMHRRDAPSPMR